MIERTSLRRVKSGQKEDNFLFTKVMSPNLFGILAPYRASVKLKRGFMLHGSYFKKPDAIYEVDGQDLTKILEQIGNRGKVKIQTHVTIDLISPFHGTLYARPRTLIKFADKRAALLFKLAYGGG